MQIKIYVSTQADGSMKNDGDRYTDVLDNREKFLKKHAIKIEDTTKVSVTFKENDYKRYKTVGPEAKGDGMNRQQEIISDALVVIKPGHALFLPLADCVGAVIYDQEKGIMMVSHLGRHSIEQNGGTKSVEYLVSNHAINPKDLKVWLSPAAGAQNYPLFSFNSQGLHQVAVNQLLSAGVLLENIDASPIDTTKDDRYYSHSQYLLGNRQTDGRFAIVAMMA